MDIRILHMIEGAKQARGLTVIIDVFRAFTVETYLMRNRARRIIPVGDVQFAFDYKKDHPDAILCGERKGIIIDGFDYGNSPSQLEHVDFTGKTVIHTTSAGTQGIANAIGADEIISGSLVNARAVSEYIKRRRPQTVSLVCMGLNSLKQTEEDNLCAEYIKSLLEGAPLDQMDKRMDDLRYTSGAKFFDPDRQSVFPQRDFDLCTRLDSVPFILRLTEDPETGLKYMERVDVMGVPQDESYCDPDQAPTTICPGDTMGKFTPEQAIFFPDAVKAEIVYRELQDPGCHFDAALVLGGPDFVMEARAKAAAQLYHSGRVRLFVTTGGVFWDSPYGCLTEAQILAKYLCDAGVPQECILTEDRANTTHDNMLRSYALLCNALGKEATKLAIVTSRFHTVRAVSLARAYIPQAEIIGIGAPAPRDNPEEYLQDPLLRQWVTKECRCLCSYVRKGLIPDFPL